MDTTTTATLTSVPAWGNVADRRGWTGPASLLAAGAVTIGLFTWAFSQQPESAPTIAVEAAAPATYGAPPTALASDIYLQEPPDGKRLVLDHAGQPRGYIDESLLDLGAAPHHVTIGGRSLPGIPVHDHEGALAGYLAGELGFVDLATASDPAAVDALLTEQEARIAAAEEELGIDFNR